MTRPYDWLTYWLYFIFGAVGGGILGTLGWLNAEGRGELQGGHAGFPLGWGVVVIALNGGAWAGYLRDRLWLSDMAQEEDEYRHPPIGPNVLAWGASVPALGFIGRFLILQGVGRAKLLSGGAGTVWWLFLVALPVALGLAAVGGGLYFLFRIATVSRESRDRKWP